MIDMANRHITYFFVIAFVSAMLASVAYAAAAQPSLTTSISAFTQWLPVMILAVMASIGIVLVYYIIGVLLNNRAIVSAAYSEYENALGTILIVVLLILLLQFFGTSVSPSLLLSTTNANNLCTTLQNSVVNFISASQQTPTQSICKNIIPSAGTTTGSSTPSSTQLTTNLDYGLASTYLVIANLTNQTASNLNSYFIYRGYINFLAFFNASDTVCWPAITCADTGVGAFNAKYTFTPFGGYEQLLAATNLLTIQSTTIFYLFIIQLMAIIVILYAWPFILAAGIILRASFLTRRVGGLLIAIAVTGLLIYPTMFLIQYNALNSLQGSSPIGASSLPNLQLVGYNPATKQTINYDKNINFYVFPNAYFIIYQAGCWPVGGLLGGELQVIGAYSLPILGEINGALNVITSLSTAVGGPQINSQLLRLGFSCSSTKAINTTFQLYNLYGMMSVIGLIFPLLNILISLAALVSISSLLGGDTRLFGIERLV